MEENLFHHLFDSRKNSSGELESLRAGASDNPNFNALLNTVLGHVGASVLMFDSAMNVLWANQRAAWQFGYEPEQMIGKCWYQLVPALQTRRPIYERVLNGESLDLFEESVDSDIGTRFLNLHYSPIWDEASRVLGMAVIADDITEQKRQQLSEEGLNRISRILSSALEIDQVYEQFAQETKALVPFDRMNLNTINQAAATYTIKYIYGPVQSGRKPGDTLSLDGTQTQEVLETLRPISVQDLQLERRYPGDQDLAPLGFRSRFLLPLISRGQVVGSLSLHSCQIAAYGPEEQEILKRLANLIAPHVDSALQYQRAQEEMLLVDRVGRIITDTLELDLVFEAFAQELKRLIDFDQINFNLIDEAKGTFLFTKVLGTIFPGRVEGDVVPLEGTRTGRAVATAKPQVHDDLMMDPQFPLDHAVAAAGLRSVITVPIISLGKVIATLVLSNGRPGTYAPREQALLERLANLIAPAIENSLVYQRVKDEMALVDNVASTFASSANISDAFDHFAGELKKLVGFDQMNFNLVDTDSGTFQKRQVSGEMNTARPPGEAWYPLENLVGEVVSTRSSLVRPDLAEHPRFRFDQDHLRLGLRSNIAVPLIAQDRVVGVLSLRSQQVGAYGSREQALLERLANLIAPAIEVSSAYAQLNQEKQRAESLLTQLMALLEAADAAVEFADQDGSLLWANQKFWEFFGLDAFGNEANAYRSADLRHHAMIPTLADPDQVFAAKEQIYNDPNYTGLMDTIEVIAPVRRLLQSYTAPILDHAGRYVGRLWMHHDVTEQHQLEQQILRAQRMESVGRLAGGVAHEFNNLLAVISGYSSLAMSEAKPGTAINDQLKQIQIASDRAAKLTRQLLTFSREQAPAATVLDLNELILEKGRLIRHLFGEAVEVVVLLEPGLRLIKADRSSVEQILVNLVMNAKDAMPQGGKLTIQTDRRSAWGAGTQPGEYVLLSIIDNGVGMTEDVMAQIFEPFFTTKDVGQGTGLGLATCYGMVTGMGGYIEVNSSPSQGSTFRVYLPVQDLVTAPLHSDLGSVATAPPAQLTVGKVVLLAEDEPMVRSLVSTVLKNQGYTVLEAANGVEALRVAAASGGQRVDLLVTDVFMPQMGGEELAATFRKSYPEVKILFMSGYLYEGGSPGQDLGSGVSFIRKPFALDVLLAEAAELLSDD